MVCSSTVCCWSVGSPWRPWGCPSEKGAESRVLGSPIACLGPGLERGTQRRLEEKAGEGYSEHVPLVRRTWGRRNFFGGSPTGLVLARCPVGEGVTDGIPGKLPPRTPAWPRERDAAALGGSLAPATPQSSEYGTPSLSGGVW